MRRFTWSVERNRQKSWGRRMKELLTALSYQWVDDPGGILSLGWAPFQQHIPFNMPSEVNMAYNGGWDPMNSKSSPPLVPPPPF